MGRYEGGGFTTAVATATAIACLSAVSRRTRVFEMGGTNNSTAQCNLATVNYTTAATAGSSNVTPVAEAVDATTGDLAATSIHYFGATLTSAVASTVLQRLTILTGAIGQSVIWAWSEMRPRQVGVGKGFGFYNAPGQTNGALAVYALHEE